MTFKTVYRTARRVSPPEWVCPSLLSDLRALHFDTHGVDYVLDVKNFSETCYGRYYPAKKRVRVYYACHKDYAQLVDTAIHEVCHHIQHSDKDFVRVKGVMHNEQFWTLYNHYSAEFQRQYKARRLLHIAKRIEESRRVYSDSH